MREQADRIVDAVGGLDRRIAWLTLAAAMLCAAALAWIWAGDRSFVIDEWQYLLQRSHWDPEVLLRPTLGHLIAGGLVLYNLAFSAFGADSHTPLTLITIALQCLVAGLLYAYCSRRLGSWVALIPAVLVLFYGAGWEILLSSATLPNQVSMATGLAAMLALDRRSRGGDVAACVLLVASVTSFSLGLAFIVGAAVRIVLERRLAGLRRLLVPAIPLLLYVAWFAWSLHYEQTDSIAASNVGSLGAGVFDQLNAAAAGITGLFRAVGHPALPVALEIDTTRTAAVVVLAGAAVVWRIARGPRMSASAWGALAIVAVYIALVALGLSEVRHATASRYAYMLTVLLLLTGSDLLAGLRIARGWLYAALAVLAFSLLANVAQMRTGGRFFEDESAYNEAELGALELVRDRADPEFVPEGGPGFAVVPYRDLTFYSREYFDAVDRFGSPADTPAEIATAAPEARRAADQLLVSALGVAVGPPAEGRPVGDLGAIEALNADAVEIGSCLRLSPSSPGPFGAQLDVPAEGFSYRSTRPPSSLSVGRFLLPPSIPIAPLPAAGSLRFAADAASQPWRASIAFTAPARICPGAPSG
ncbi:MAG: hypothetical protein U0R51_06605 [Solirubrobacterales bacterium]